MISISKYNHKKAVEYFERSKYKKLEKLIRYADTDNMSVKELVQLISFKALVEQKLHGIYWSDEVAKLTSETLIRVNKSRLSYIKAKLSINKAQSLLEIKKMINALREPWSYYLWQMIAFLSKVVNLTSFL